MNDLCQHEVVSSERNFSEYLSEVTETANVQRGTPLPLGVYAYDGGVNFALFSRHATRVRLELFTSTSDSIPERIIDLDPVRNRTGDVWHAWIKGIATGQLYAYRVDGPCEPGKGNRFDFRKLLLDPRATALARVPCWDFAAAPSDESADGDAHTSNIDDAKAMPKCVVTEERFDWHDDRPPQHPWSKTVIYETHVRGFTRDVSSGVQCPGTYRGLTEKTPYLKELGVTAVELLPVQEFNPNALTRRDPQVGSFSERRWVEWNGRYRDDVRRFWRGDDGMLCAFASRICGSEDLYAKSGKGPECSINFVTCHNGFTLNDLVSFQSKHNVANGEDNRDGADENFSANYGVEGSSDDPRVESVRQRQIKNFLLTLFISRGVPMLLGGDEFRRTQLGNNNAYCQDNETSWYDWSRLRRHPDIHRFVRRVAALRRAYPVLTRERFYTPAEISWFAATLKTPDWSDPRAKALGCLIRGAGRDALYLMFNAHDKPVSFIIPVAPDRGRWQLAIDTSQELPTMPDSTSGSCVDRTRPYVLEPRSSAVLIACGSVAGAGDSPIAPAAVATGGCDSLIDHCATSIGGKDPSTAYAAAMLWYQGYPGPPPGGG
jgi:pullulanase/glycogen debranching enzyme